MPARRFSPPWFVEELDACVWCRLHSKFRVNGDEEACEVLIAFVGVPVIGLCYSALGETRRVKERSRTRPSRLCAGGSATTALWNDGPTAIRSVHERARLEVTRVTHNLSRCVVRHSRFNCRPSALGGREKKCPLYPAKADIGAQSRNVRFVPIANMRADPASSKSARDNLARDCISLGLNC
jgi:hypothetical protein